MEHERHFQKNKRMRMAAKGKNKSTSSNSSKSIATESKNSAGGNFKRSGQKQKPDRKVEIQTDTKSDKKAEKKPDNKSDKKVSSRKEPPSPCPKCQEMHWLNDCPKATDADKVTLRQKLREANKARKARVKRLKKLLPGTSRTVTLNGVLELPCCPDTGSDNTLMTQLHWELLHAADPSVVQMPLDKPVHIETFGAHPVVAKAKTKLHVTIHTAAGPVQLSEAIPCMIVDTEDDEFIVGRDVLGALGIDVDRQLEQLAIHQDDEGSGDPFVLEADEPLVNINQPASDEDIRAAVEILIDRAIKNGFPLDKVDKLRVIVHMYDVWRLVLRDDPPARVPPLEVRLKEGAKPTK